MSETRSRDILDATATAIAERGLCDTRIADIAEIVGVSPALILYYFPTKAALLAEALIRLEELFYARVRKRMESATGAEDRLAILIEESCPSPAGEGDLPDTWALWPATWEMARHDTSLAGARARLDEAWRNQITSIVEDGISSGEFDAVDPTDFALQLAAMLDGLAVEVMLGDPAVDSERMSELARSFSRKMLGPSKRTTR
jgi:AcrR family transcriptional regulator